MSGGRPDEQRKPIWTRWWFVGIAVFGGISLISLLLPSDSEPLVSPTTAVAQAPTTAPPAPATTQPPPSTTTTTLGFDPFTISGSGSDAFAFSVPDDLATVLEITHSGSSAFSVSTFAGDAEPVELLVETEGAYQGSRAINLIVSEVVTSIEVVADGQWEITATYLGDLERKLDEAAGTGDAVLIMDLTAPVMTIHHDGDGPFSVFLWTFQNQGFLVNDVGPVDEIVRTPTGGVVVEVEASGDWRLSTRG